MTRRLLLALVAVVSALGLLVGAASPGTATANESPSPPALGAFISCSEANQHVAPNVGDCPAISRASSSAVLNNARKMTVGVFGAVIVLVAAAVVTLVVPGPARRARHRLLGLLGARAPPVSLS